MKTLILATTLFALCGTIAFASSEDDPFLWLEEVEGEKAFEWVHQQNEITSKALQKVSEYESIHDKTMQILDSKDRIPYPGLRGDSVYNLWQDDTNPRGLLRRTTIESYMTETPEWETVIDMDKLVEEEGIPWVFGGATCLAPEHRVCMVALSRGGSDATVMREFDAETKQFVEGGFQLPEAKTNVAWRDKDHLLVATDFGPDSLTTSGYPRRIEVWKRGTALENATPLFEAGVDDVFTGPYTIHTETEDFELVVRVPVFYRQETFLRLGNRLVKLDIPFDSDFHGIIKNQILVQLRSEWKAGDETFPPGALIATDLDEFLQGKRDFEVLFEPSQRVSLNRVTTTRNTIVLSILDNVIARLETLEPVESGWQRRKVELPGPGTVSIVSTSDTDDTFFFTYESFLSPDTLFISSGGTAKPVKSMPAFFDAGGMKVTQHEATSKDGEKIPYFLVTPAGFKADGTTPTILYGYGGFENPELPRYSAVKGSAWMARGGAYVVANIRGGGEFGPRWHQAALKENRIKSFEDFIAVAEDLVARKITSPEHLGIVGGSQGGLLVAGCMTLRPDLFGAVVSQVPLTDMRRFNKLLAGASWMGEYGNPDIPEEWAYIKTWSPYHLVSAKESYPKAFFWTTTRDDRVHPGHARKMAAKMMAQGLSLIHI